MLYILYILLYITILNYIRFYRGRFIFLVAFSCKVCYNKVMEEVLNFKKHWEKNVKYQCKQDFYRFVNTFAPTIVSDWQMGKHIKVISEKLKQLESGEIKRLMVFLPPRSSKSVICSKLFPAWYIGRNPEHEILTVSHSDQLSSAGRGAHIAILDDVMSEEDSYSEAGRRYVKEWYPAGLRTRIMPNGSILIINTRYHYDDLCGWLLKQESEFSTILPWEVIRIPAWLDEASAELLELPVGSSYFPEWKTTESLKIDEQEIRASNGARYWNALYMQDPTPDEGGLIKKKWLQWWEYDEPPACDFIIQTYDTAFSTKTTADYSVIQTWGIFSRFEQNEHGYEDFIPNLILLGNMKGRFEYPELRRIAQMLYDEFKPDVCIIEKKASGQSLLQDMRRAGLPVQDYIPDKDKVARVHAASPMIEAGRVWLPKNKKWSDDLYTEILQFPNSAHDDQVDAMTMAIHYMKESWRLTHPDDPYIDEEINNKKRVAYWRV